MLNKRILTLVFVVAFVTLLVGCLPTTNHTPIITSDPVKTADVGVAYTYNVNATDPDEDTLTYSLVTKPTGMSISSTTGLINWIPTAEGNYAVVVKVSDGTLDITQSFTIVVSGEEEPGVTPPKKYTITATAGDGGSISPSGAVKVIKGSNKTFTITSTVFYRLLDVFVDGGSVGAISPYTFTNVTAVHTIHADFILIGKVYNQNQGEHYNEIQLAVNDANSGDTILVMEGTYSELVVVDRSLTILGANAGVCAGVNPGNRGAESIVNAFEISVDDVVIDGFQINGDNTGAGFNAIYLLGGTSGHIISNNILPGLGGQIPTNARGIEFGQQISNTTVICNEIYGWNSGNYINPSDDLLFQYNNFHHNNVGIGSDGLNDVSILNNNFSYNFVEGFGSSNVGNNVIANFNNFITNSVGVNWYSGNKIDAKANWWNHVSGPSGAGPGTGDAISTNVDYIPWSMSSN